MYGYLGCRADEPPGGIAGEVPGMVRIVEVESQLWVVNLACIHMIQQQGWVRTTQS
jgi:hypothetical protein